MQKYEFKPLGVLFSSKDYRAKFLLLMKCLVMKKKFLIELSRLQLRYEKGMH